MKIIVNINHPANVHYFKNFIFQMQKEGHSITISARNKDVSFKLLNAYNLKYIDFGKGNIGKGAIGKMLYLIFASFRFLLLFLKNKPNIVLSFGAAPLAIVAYFFRVPHICFDDTEHAKLIKKLYVPFTPLVISPSCFYDDLGKNHFLFNGYMELFYLHKNRFKPNYNILKELNISRGEVFTLFRFVSWEAFHDIGQKKLNLNEKIELVKEAEKYGKVFISSEGKLPKELKKYRIHIQPEKLHDVLYFAKLYIGEGGTTASECAMLATPSIYINTLPLMGYLRDAERFDLLYHLFEIKEIKLKMKSIYKKPDNFYKMQNEKLLKNVIDPTSLLVWIVNNYPESKKILMSNPNFQIKF
tara:strand:- start:7791 stop:8861 length:1071 start_codon:yes stop_codon:yes gene_type:complete